MGKNHASQYANFGSLHLPAFIYDHVELFRSFILSVQITNVNNKLSHIFVFTYKE